jgi:hypothetical protein
MNFGFCLIFGKTGPNILKYIIAMAHPGQFYKKSSDNVCVKIMARFVEKSTYYTGMLCIFMPFLK